MNAIVQYQARLMMPAELSGIDPGKWRVLCEATFPSAKTPQAIMMAVDYCRARGLDVFKKPVHIVPMWNTALGREVETVWPGINEVQITAARTGKWAGMDAPVWGAMVTNSFSGTRRAKGGSESVQVTVEYPEWCSVTVYRMIDGVRCAFTEPVYWLEAYSRAGGTRSELPTDMWIKRPHGQLHKVAKAAALRAAFPEEGEYTAEEMEGKELDPSASAVVIEAPAVPQAPPPEPESEPDPAQLQAECVREMTDAITTWDSAKQGNVTKWWNSDEQKARRREARLSQDDVNKLVELVKQRRGVTTPPDAVSKPAVPPAPAEVKKSDLSADLSDDDEMPDPSKDYPAFVNYLANRVHSFKGQPFEEAETWFQDNIMTMPSGTLMPPDLAMLRGEKERLRSR